MANRRLIIPSVDKAIEHARYLIEMGYYTGELDDDELGKQIYQKRYEKYLEEKKKRDLELVVSPFSKMT